MLGKAIALAAKVHENQTDKGGHAYILHPLRVMNSLGSTDKELCAIAVLHDAIEDSDLTEDDLRRQGFPERVVVGVAAMSRRPGETYETFIERCSCNVDARRVKLEDLRDNSDITRLKGIGKKDLARIEKYHKAWVYLSEKT